MTNKELLSKIKKDECFKKLVKHLGEHGHGHYHSAAPVTQ